MRFRALRAATIAGATCSVHAGVGITDIVDEGVFDPKLHSVEVLVMVLQVELRRGARFAEGATPVAA